MVMIIMIGRWGRADKYIERRAPARAGGRDGKRSDQDTPPDAAIWI